MSWLRTVREYFAPAERSRDLRDVQGAGDDANAGEPEAVILIDGGLEHVVPVPDGKSHQITFGGRTWHHVTEREGVWVYRPTK